MCTCVRGSLKINKSYHYAKFDQSNRNGVSEKASLQVNTIKHCIVDAEPGTHNDLELHSKNKIHFCQGTHFIRKISLAFLNSSRKVLGTLCFFSEKNLQIKTQSTRAI